MQNCTKIVYSSFFIIFFYYVFLFYIKPTAAQRRLGSLRSCRPYTTYPRGQDDAVAPQQNIRQHVVLRLAQSRGRERALDWPLRLFSILPELQDHVRMSGRWQACACVL